ncbi:MAG TPA: hypothetical protein VH234_00455 [Candidatus Saccharimonadales bacterium]|jgi:hypothetical protein|nr:hypothetical protein [Candidatus Saccharimonadales bacterium]
MELTRLYGERAIQDREELEAGNEGVLRPEVMDVEVIRQHLKDIHHFSVLVRDVSQEEVDI